MRHKTLSLIAGGLLLGSATQAQLQRIVLQGSGAPQVFADINVALAAAQPNDRLYFSGGTFISPAAVTIGVPLHFIGAGIGPDSTAVTGVTTLSTTSGSILITTPASGSTFTGIIFSPSSNVEYGTTDADDDPTNLVFDRCTFATPVVFADAAGCTSSTIMKECVFYSSLSGLGTACSVTLDRCIIDYSVGTGAEVNAFAGGLTLRHCVGLNMRVGNSPGVTSENCIYTKTTAPFWQSNGAILTNNMCVCTGLVSNMSPASATGNVLGVAQGTIFINELDNNFTWDDDLHLQPGSQGIGMATDGTDAGIYGSSSPFKPGAVPFNPHFRSATIATSTLPNGDLPVNIRVAAQTN
ncbi:MAG: hypothetical protein IPK70_02970 [Flavobacteriales bacterium]|jgi:hypothetical protein|nr:hypothetical protein [Flavobacteriales bacterium]